jgi:hypothetical protein
VLEVARSELLGSSRLFSFLNNLENVIGVWSYHQELRPEPSSYMLEASQHTR